MQLSVSQNKLASLNFWHMIKSLPEYFFFTWREILFTFQRGIMQAFVVELKMLTHSHFTSQLFGKRGNKRWCRKDELTCQYLPT